MNEKTVIILEDNPGDYFILERLLNDIGVKSEQISWYQKLSDFKYNNEEFIFCDLNLPDSDGIDTVKSVKQKVTCENPNLIVLTGFDDERVAQEAIQFGAQDYLVKGTFGLTFLKKTMVFSSERIKLIQDLKLEQERTQKAEASLSAILKSVPSVIIMFDNDNRILYLNKGFGLELDTASFIGMDILDLVHFESRNEDARQLETLKSSREMVSAQSVAMDSYGNHFDVVYRAVPLDKDSYVLVASDISDLMRINQELRKESQRSRTMQLKLLSSQLNPHFVFNAMSSIQHSTLFNDTETSLNVISNFSSVMRGVLENSRKKLIAWTDEKNFLSKYLELEQFRLENKFDFSFSEEDGGESLYLPPMLLQPFVENAVMHGVGNLKDRKGVISIDLEFKDESVIVYIRDNGIGRKKSADLWALREGDRHISRAMSISEQRLHLLNSFSENESYFITINDLFDDKQQPAGTEVEIRLPSEVNFE